MKFVKNTVLDYQYAKYFADHREINFSKLINNLLKRYFVEANIEIKE